MRSVEWKPEALASYDAVLIATDHDCIDWQTLADNASLVIDTRNAMKDTTPSRATIIKA